MLFRDLQNEEKLRQYLIKIGLFGLDPVLSVRPLLEKILLNYSDKNHHDLLNKETGFLGDIDLPIACSKRSYVDNLNIFAGMLAKFLVHLPTDSYCTLSAGWHKQSLIVREIKNAEGQLEKVYELFDSNLSDFYQCFRSLE